MSIFLWLISVFLLQTSITCTETANATLESTPIAQDTYGLVLTIPCSTSDAIYRDYIIVSADHSAIGLSPWKTQTPSVCVYDKRFKKDKHIFTQTLTLALQAHVKTTVMTPTHLHLTYVTQAQPMVIHTSFPLPTSGTQLPGPIAALSPTPQPLMLTEQSPTRPLPLAVATAHTAPDDEDCCGWRCLASGLLLIMLAFILYNDQKSTQLTLTRYAALLAFILGTLFVLHANSVLIRHQLCIAEEGTSKNALKNHATVVKNPFLSTLIS